MQNIMENEMFGSDKEDLSMIVRFLNLFNKLDDMQQQITFAFMMGQASNSQKPKTTA